VTAVDAGGGQLNVTLSATNGTLTLGALTGLTFTSGDGTGDVTMTFRGSLNRINAALDGLVFSPDANFEGTAGVQVAVDDQGNSGWGGALSDSRSVAITVNGVNDAPVNTVPGPQSVNEDNNLIF